MTMPTKLSPVGKLLSMTATRKRKQAEVLEPDSEASTPSKKRNRLDESFQARGIHKSTLPNRNEKNRKTSENGVQGHISAVEKVETPRAKRTKTAETPSSKLNKADATVTPTSRKYVAFENRNISYITPSKQLKRSANGDTSSPMRIADRSARRKSAKRLIEETVAEDVEDEAALVEEDILAKQIYDEDAAESSIEGSEPGDTIGVVTADGEVAVALETPLKRGRGRPKGSKRKKSPTPPPNLPPHEWYFYQNRTSANKTSSNTLSSFPLMTHEEYNAAISRYNDRHNSNIDELQNIHEESFSLWALELSQSYSLCLYGYGSKGRLMTSFATYLHTTFHNEKNAPLTIIANGTDSSLTIRTILMTIANVTCTPNSLGRLPKQPEELLTYLFEQLSASSNCQHIYILLKSALSNSAINKPASQSILASLSLHPRIHLVLTADDPSFPLLWDVNLRDKFNFVFHDATTFAPYDDSSSGRGEVGDVVSSVHELLGRKAGGIRGREGVRWVLSSLPENARGLYRILVSEILSLQAEQDGEEEDDIGADAFAGRSRKVDAELVGVEYKQLYQKAVEEFLCSSEVAFRTLLKEFLDHQMVIIKRDTGGAEVIGLPLGKVELEGVLEDLVG